MKHDERRRRPAMEIAISGISDGDHPFTFDVPAAGIGLEENFPGNVRVSGVLQKVSTHLAVHATASVVNTRTCDRCLATNDVAMEIPLDIYYLETASERRRVEGEEEYRTLRPDQESIVLDDEVRESLLVNIPLKSLCRDDCRGLCPGCGVDLNTETCTCASEEVDPRWAKLADVFKPKPDTN